MSAIAISIVSIVISSVIGIVTLLLSSYSVKKVIENSYPIIESDIKLKEDWSVDITLKNTGKSVAYDVYSYLGTGWGNTKPNLIQITELVPGYSETRNVKLPEDKKGAVYFINLVLRGNRKNFWRKKKALPEQKRKYEFNRKEIESKEFWYGSLDLK